MVFLNPREQEYLLAAVESSLRVRDARSCFLWAQGPLQALLPHRILVCMQLAPDGALRHLECLHSSLLEEGARQRLTEPAQGLALRLARHYRGDGSLPAALNAADGAGSQESGEAAAFAAELRRDGLDNVLLHGTEQLADGATFFALFGMPEAAGQRHAYVLQLLLPQLHLAAQRMRQSVETAAQAAGARRVSAREMEILHWVREGKSNQEVGQILGISGLTVKNHLQRIYKLMGVNNRTQAVSRLTALPERHMMSSCDSQPFLR